MFKKTVLISNSKLGLERGSLVKLVPVVIEQLVRLWGPPQNVDPKCRRSQFQINSIFLGFVLHLIIHNKRPVGLYSCDSLFVNKSDFKKTTF